MQIYKITNTINDRFYIGKTTKSLEERWNKHQKYNKCPKLFNAIKKYGANKFKIESIEICDLYIKLNEREIFWIKKLKAIELGYNIAKGGDGGAMTGEALQKIKISAKNRVVSLETRKKMSKRVLGDKNITSRKVVVTLENNVQICFSCIKYASQFLGIADSTGRSLARGIKAISKNIKIEYIGDSKCYF